MLLISIVVSKTSGRAGIPSLLLFLGIGMLAGSEGIGGIHFDDPKVAQHIGTVALTFILFAGGLETRWQQVKTVLWQGVTLSTLGVVATSAAIGFFLNYFTAFSLIEGFLLGAIVSSTDAAAVFSILRSKSIGLKGNLRPLLELESGSNDPMAFFLTTVFTALLLNPEIEKNSLVLSFFSEMLIGAAAGMAMGYIMSFTINRIKLEYDGLYPVLSLALVLISYSATDYLGGNGFLAVYISAIVLGNKQFIHKRSLLRFHDGISWLMQILMFLTLGLLVFPSRMLPIAGTALLISLFIIFIARPIGIFLSLLLFKINIREKLFISWVGLRGAAPILFATYPMVAGAEKADLIFNLVFFIVLTSILLQGTTISAMAKIFNVKEDEAAKPKTPVELELDENIKNELFEIEIPENSKVAGKTIAEMRLPGNILVVLINRYGDYITPNGSTVINAKDKILIMVPNGENISLLNQKFGI